MPADEHRWDPSTPGFVMAVLRTLLLLCALASLVSFLISSKLGFGVISGVVIAVGIYLNAMFAGRSFSRSSNFAKILGWLIIPQFFLWVAMACLLALVKVHPLGFIIGVTNLPISVLLTLAWYLIRKRLG